MDDRTKEQVRNLGIVQWKRFIRRGYDLNKKSYPLRFVCKYNFSTPGPGNSRNWIIKLVEGLPNLLRGFREGFTIKTSIVVEGSS